MSDSEDDFVTFGNALEPLDEENLPRKKPITIEEQCAYDAQGRRRFHGAFTGGFSAGYFNTVGTRDGWRPQQFKSTRSSKAGSVVQRPEDFMDDEDTGEFGIAPTAIRATQDYSDQTNKGTKRERAKGSTGPIPGTPVLRELLKPVRERVGVILLKKMGWKPGQGVGPRLTKKEKKQKRKQNEKIKIYGCSLPNQVEKPDDSESDYSDDEFANITFAPDDYEPFRCNPKDNYFGIGYSGLDRRPILSSHINLFDGPAFSVQDKNKTLSIRGQAFGVGAFEAEDDDIYAKDDMSRYDFALGPERKSKSRWSKETKPKTGCIEGFVPAKEQFPQKKVFAAPELPKDYQPIHKVRKSRFSPAAEPENDKRKRHEMNAESRARIINDDRPSILDSRDAARASTSTSSGGGGSSTAANLIVRTLNLHGREQTAERQRLEQSAAKKSTTMSWLDKLASTSFVKGETIGTDPSIRGSLQEASSFVQRREEGDATAVQATKPTFADLDKQRRFEQYLGLSEGERKVKLAGIQPLSMTEWDRDQEAAEFERAARLCESIDRAEVKEEVAPPPVDLESLGAEERMRTAAKMRMFGKFTRTDVEWKPVKLVCVRFNVAEPMVGVALEGQKKKKFSIFDNVAWNEMAKFEKGQLLERDCEAGPSTSTSSGSSRHRGEAKNAPRGPPKGQEEEEEEEEAKPVSAKEAAFRDTYDKVFGGKGTEASAEAADGTSDEGAAVPAKANVKERKDLFKSIFLSSSEDEEEEEEKEKSEASKAAAEEKVKLAILGKRAAEMNVERNNSPPRGIFAKLDLDGLTKRPATTVKQQPAEDADTSTAEQPRADDRAVEVKVEEEEAEAEATAALPVDAYGPALPKQLPPVAEDLSTFRPIFTGASKTSDEAEPEGTWVEKSRDKKKSKKEKKKHKHKERSRSKSRKKSKKEKRH